MKSPFYFVTNPVKGRRYDNIKEIGGVDFILSVSEEDYNYSNRYAEVIETPAKYNGPIQKGDILLVHHNVFKFYNDMKGKQRSGRSFFRDNDFLIEPDQFFMYKHDGEWHAYDKYCFVKPIAAIDSYVKKPFTNEPLMGEMVYPNKYLLDRGIGKGDRVCFVPDSEYVFNVDGEKMYRLFDHQVTIKL